MKKTLLLICAIMASISGAWAQTPTNYAASASIHPASGTPETFFAEGAERTTQTELNGLTNGTTNDAHYIGGKTSSSDQTPVINSFYLDLGEGALNYKIIKMYWEGAYASGYSIYGSYSTDNLKANKLFEQNSAPNTGNSNPQRYTFENAASYRYLYFDFSAATATNINWGVKMYEIQVYEDYTPTLTTLTASCNNTSLSIGGTSNITVAGKDQFGDNTDTGVLTWMSTEPTVASVDGGTVTALAAGTTNITAQSSDGSVVSNAISFTVLGGTKIDLFTNWQYRIYPIGADTKFIARDGLVDNNLDSQWVLHDETNNNEESRTYETGFIADLGAIYNINSISIRFDGACPEDYTISFAGNDGIFGNAAYSVTSHAGMTAYTEIHSGVDVTGARYVKFLSTKAATEFGIKIKDFTVIGTQTSTINNGTNPSITTASISSPTNNSLTLNITSSDGEDDSAFLMYLVTGAGSERWMVGQPGSAESFILGGLNEGTEYSINIIAYDAVGHGSTIYNVNGTTTGGTPFVLTAAPTPPERASADVKSIYSNAYTVATTYSYGSWGQTTQVTTETISSDEILKLTNFNYLGFEYATDINLAGMDYVHIDVLPMQTMNMTLSPILRPGGGEAGTENLQSVGTLTEKEWNSVDIPMSKFSGLNFSTDSHQFKIADGSGSVYVDNIYFWRFPVNTNTIPAAPTPNKFAVNVKSLYCDEYTAIGGVTWHSDWEAGSTIVDATLSSDNAKKVTAFKGFGITITDIDINTAFGSAAKGHLCFDIYPLAVGTVKVDITKDGFAHSGNVQDVSISTSDLDKWIHKDILLSNFIGEQGFDKITALLFNGGDGSAAFYIDNIYFYKEVEDVALTYGTPDANNVVAVTGTLSESKLTDFNSALTGVAYDLTGITLAEAVTISPANVNTILIVTAEQKAAFGTTKNMVIWNAGNSRYEGDIEIVDQNNANAFATQLNLYATNMTYTRAAIAADRYVTTALPFVPTTVTDGFSIYYPEAAPSSKQIRFIKTNNWSREPYILHNTNDVATDFVASASNVALNFTPVTVRETLKSVFTSQTLTSADNAYVLQNSTPGLVEFKKANGVGIGAFRGYLYTTSLEARLAVVFGNGETTKIGTINANGEINVEDGVYYNLAGQRVQNPTKGIYIINGKKVVLK